MPRMNHQFRLAARPVGLVKPSDWSFTEESIRQPEDGEVLVEVLYVSLDPAMRGWMNEGRSYIPPVGIGEVMRAGGVGRVSASNSPAFSPGDYVSGALGVQEFSCSDATGFTKVDPLLAPLPVYLSALGIPGMTAYFGLFDVGRAQKGETVVVSGAAGAVGGLVGQLARIRGCRVVGLAGGPAKCEYVMSELGFDAAIDYKSENVPVALRTHCPAGIDVYFDNVGGDILDAALGRLARGARIVICGAISQYNNTGPVSGPSNYLSLLVNRATMAGFVVFDYADRYAEAASDIAGWMKAGDLTSREDIIEGLDQFPGALQKLFTGENLGKLVLKVGED